MSTYQIVDEPKSSRFSGLMVNPFWIVLGTMLGGLWLGWPWFVLNSFAIGSFHKTRELLAVVIGFVGAVLLTSLGMWLLHQGYLDSRGLPYAGLVLVAWKLTITYALQLWQSPGFELAFYFRGRSRNGALLSFAALFLKFQVLRGLPDFWYLVLS